MTRHALPAAFTLSLALSVAGPSTALAQAPPGGGLPGGGATAGVPSKQEIEKRIKEELDKLPEYTAELGGIKIIYKAVPSDPAEIVKNSGQLPAGTNPDQAVKQFLPFARPYIEKYLGEIGKIVTDEEIKIKSVKVAPGEYVFGVVMQELCPVAIRISGKGLKAPITIPLKPQAAKEPYAALKVELEEGKKNDEFKIGVGFAKILGSTTWKMQHVKK